MELSSEDIRELVWYTETDSLRSLKKAIEIQLRSRDFKSRKQDQQNMYEDTMRKLRLLSAKQLEDVITAANDWLLGEKKSRKRGNDDDNPPHA